MSEHAPADLVASRVGVQIELGADMAEEVTKKTEEVMQTESQVRKAILEGMDPQDAYKKYGRF